ncbi:hypothetical protein Goshw_024751, partial [Gossypium schwendimanii]|nr:hypothetical protein [Gossypium schwendimanii]
PPSENEIDLVENQGTTSSLSAAISLYEFSLQPLFKFFVLYVNMAKVTFHFVIVIIGLLFNHTCTFTGSEKDNVLRGRTYLVDVRQRTCDCGFK